MKKDSLEMNRRAFLKTASLAAAAGMVWMYGGELALGQVRWEDELETIPPEQWEGIGIEKGSRVGGARRTNYPRIAFDETGLLWCVWAEQKAEDDEGIYIAVFDGEQFSEPHRVSSEGNLATRPAIAPAGMAGGDPRMAVCWQEKKPEGWRVCLSWFTYLPAEGRFAQAGSDACFAGTADSTPAIAQAGNDTNWLAWVQGGERDEVIQTRRQGTVPGDGSAGPLGSNHPSRPAVATAPNGATWVAWDQQEGPGNRAVYIQELTEAGEVAEPVRVTHHPAMNIAPALAFDDEGRLWIAFQSNRRGNDRWDIPRWIYLKCYHEGRLYEPVSKPVAMNLDKEGTDQSFEFPRLLCAPDGKVIVTGRPSHNFCLQYYHGGEWSPLYRVPKDGWGGRGQILDSAFSPDGDLYVVRRDIGMNLLNKITGIVGQKKEPELQPAAGADAFAKSLANIITAPKRWEPLEEYEGGGEPLNVYYGDIHGHTWMSDGLGDVDEYYITRRDYYQHDFASLTDHDTFVGKSISPSEWELIKEVTQRFHSEDFVTIFGQEWTTARYPANAGHKCIYSLDPDIPLFDHDYSKYRVTRNLYPELKKWDVLIFPHHTGWTGTDWENLDPEIQTLAEICSNHGVFEYPGNKPIPHRGNARGCFIQDGLAAGHRFGLIGGTDSHGLIWHHHAGWKRDCNRSGLACVLAPDLSRESLFNAMRKRRTFATTGIKPRLDFRVANYLMGDEFETEEDSVRVRFNCAAQEDIRWVTIVKNNEDIYTYGGDGYTTRFSFEDELAPGTSYYYARVEFDGPEMAWSSPVWVTRRG